MTAPSARCSTPPIRGFRFPARLVATSRRKQKPLAEFALYGPTCDSSDYLPGPFVLPECVREGDYIEIGQIGAYGRVLANHFNGYGEYDEVILTDEPMLSMYSSADEPIPRHAEDCAKSGVPRRLTPVRSWKRT